MTKTTQEKVNFGSHMAIPLFCSEYYTGFSMSIAWSPILKAIMPCAEESSGHVQLDLLKCNVANQFDYIQL